MSPRPGGAGARPARTYPDAGERTGGPAPPSRSRRLLLMTRLGLAVMVHDPLRFTGTLLGVVFAVVLTNQALGTLFGIVHKNAVLLRNTPADLWIVPAGTVSLTAGKVLSTAAIDQARVTPGVARAEPLLFVGATLALPDGGREPLTVIGVADVTSGVCRPWSVIDGDPAALRRPDTLVFESSERDSLGGLNLGSVREVSGHRVVVGAFTFGVTILGGSLAFADYDLARELGRVPADHTSYGLIQLAPGADPQAVQAALARRVPEAVVLTRAELDSVCLRTLLTKSPVGIVFGASTVFGVVIGFVIVALSMVSAVVDNLREFGTLKALGCTDGDLMALLGVQSIAYGGLGSLLGLALVSLLTRAISTAKLTFVTPPWLALATLVGMVGMCVAASALASLRVREVEPAMVFR